MNFINLRKYFYIGSFSIIAIGMIFLGIFGLNLGIEFKSGTSMNILFLKNVSTEEVRSELMKLGYKEAFIQRTEKDAIILKLENIKIEELANMMSGKFGAVRVLKKGDELVLLFEKTPKIEDVKALLSEKNITCREAEKIKCSSFYIRTRSLNPEKRDERGNIIEPSEEEKLKEKLSQKLGDLIIYDVYTIFPMIAFERTKYTLYAIIAAAFGILIYITWAFRKLKGSFRYGVCALIALLHDVLMVVGLFAIMGKFFDIRVNSMFIIGVLTIIGYSVNDTIVIFDRIRENRAKFPGSDFGDVINRSILESLGRSLNTSLTTLFVLLSLLFIGGPVLRSFILSLLIGIISGTYSSLFIASPLLFSWERGEIRGIIRIRR